MIRLTPAFATTTASNLTAKNNALNNTICVKNTHYQVIQDLYKSNNSVVNNSNLYHLAENEYTNQNVVFNSQNTQKQDKNVELYNYYDNTGYQYGLNSNINNNQFSTEKSVKSGEETMSGKISTLLKIRRCNLI